MGRTRVKQDQGHDKTAAHTHDKTAAYTHDKTTAHTHGKTTAHTHDKTTAHKAAVVAGTVSTRFTSYHREERVSGAPTGNLSLFRVDGFQRRESFL